MSTREAYIELRHRLVQASLGRRYLRVGVLQLATQVHHLSVGAVEAFLQRMRPRRHLLLDLRLVAALLLRKPRLQR